LERKAIWPLFCYTDNKVVLSKIIGNKMMHDIQTAYKGYNFGFEDFTKEVNGDVLIEKVNFSRATFKEAQEFKDRLVYDILTNNIKIIIDLSSCEYIDSTFLGALVVVLKKMAERGGELKYVIPQPSALYLFKITGLYGVLNLYRNKEEALESFA
jgi:anti-anti-sigma factor